MYALAGHELCAKALPLIFTAELGIEIEVRLGHSASANGLICVTESEILSTDNMSQE